MRFIADDVFLFTFQNSGSLEYFYLTAVDGNLSVPAKSPFQAVDDYLVWVRSLDIKPRDRSFVRLDNRLFMTYWDGTNNKVRVIKFRLK